jgi:hypothetical protein
MRDSGTEDYFLSASYFDEGTFASSQAGLTWKNSVGSGDLSMYKTHTRDLVPFHGGMQYMWRNNEDGKSCPNHASPTRSARARSSVGSPTFPAAPAPPNALAAQWPGSVAEAREAPTPRKQVGLGERTQQMNLTSITMFYSWPSQA